MIREAKPQTLPMDDLSDAAWARIGANLRTRLDAGEANHPRNLRGLRPTTDAWLRGGGTLVAAAAALWLLWWWPADAPPAVAPRPVRVVATEHMQLAHAGDANIELSPQSALSVQGDEASGYTVRLESGSARFSVPPRQGRPPFRVVTGKLEVEVVGTRFEVSARPRAVAVEEGTVRVHWAGKTHRVSAGQRWRLPRVDAPGQEVEAPAVATPTPQPQEQAGSPEGRRNPETWERRPRARAGARRSAGATPQQRFEAAAALEARQPAKALRAYQALARGEGPWAANALFAAARLQLELHREREAHALLKRYLRRFPEGPNRADARTLLERGH